MIKTYIIGTGNFSFNLSKKIKFSQIYSTKNFLKEISVINENKSKINIIINSFFSSKKIHEINKYNDFVIRTVFNISKILDSLKPKIINKIIYTSSSSVYGSINSQFLNVVDNNREIYAAFKIAAECLIKNFCKKNKIPIIICRVFNLYGNNDDFSILQAIKKVIKTSKKIKIFNKGLSVRDYIHVEDVIKIYSYILKNIHSSNYFDIGTGKGLTLLEIIKKLNLKDKNIIFEKKKIREIKYSIARNHDILKKIPNIKFKNVEEYLNISEKLHYKKNIGKNYIDYKF